MPNVYQTVFGGSLVAPAIPTYLALNLSANVILGWPLESNITSPAAAEIIDVTATAPALTIQLSDARQISSGYCALFNNVGANTVTILDAQGNVLMTPASGQAWQIYLADNSTLQGTWRVFQYGAGVSSANAASLAGNGLKAISTTLNERIVINAQAVNFSIAGADRASCLEWTGGSGGVFTAPAPATVGSDWFCYIKNAGTGTLTLSPAAGTIDGSASKTFNPGDSCILVSDGATLFTMGFGQSVASSFNFVTISLNPPGTGTIVLAGAQLNRISYKFTGALTGNVIVQVPASIQQYWVDNETTGAFTLTISTGGGGTFTVPQTSRVILYCDGLNIVNAVSSGAGSITLVADGTAAAPGLAWASDTQLGLYKVGPDILGITTAGVQRVQIDTFGHFSVINGVAFGSGLGATTQVIMQAGGAGVPQISLVCSAAAANQRIYDSFSDSSGTLHFRAVNDAYAAANDWLQVTRSGATPLALLGWGPVAAANVDMTPDTGTFTGAGIGFTAGVNFACTWSRYGKLVLLTVGANVGTSNSTAFSMSGLPAAIQPATLNQWCPVGSLINNNVVATGPTGVIITAGSGTISFTLNGNSAGFTAANAKGTNSSVQGMTIAYLLN